MRGRRPSAALTRRYHCQGCGEAWMIPLPGGLCPYCLPLGPMARPEGDDELSRLAEYYTP